VVFAHKFYSGSVRLQLATHKHALDQGIRHFVGHGV
jgi:hypothetical protein